MDAKDLAGELTVDFAAPQSRPSTSLRVHVPPPGADESDRPETENDRGSAGTGARDGASDGDE